MREALRNAVITLDSLLAAHVLKPLDTTHFHLYVDACVMLARYMSTTQKNAVTKEIYRLGLTSTSSEIDLWDESELYSLFLARKAFDMANIPLNENIFIKLHRQTVENLPEEESSPLLITIPSHILYEKLAMAVANGHRGSFERLDEDKWPTHKVDEKTLQADILMRPTTRSPLSLLENSPQYTQFFQLMTARLDQLDVLTLDVMNIICARWLKVNPSSPQEMIQLTADDILEARGLQKKPNADGRRGGYTREQRDAIQSRMAALSSLWISVTDMRITAMEEGKRVRKSTRYESPALLITGRFGETDEEGDVDLWNWNVRPGDVFSTFLLNPVSRETGLFPEKSWQYDPMRQSWEKRLSVYLSWQWRVQRTKNGYKPYRVKTLLKSIHEPVNQQHPNRTRDRLEKALDQLQADKLIQNWQYDKSCTEDSLPTREWVEVWLLWKIKLLPPKQIMLLNQDEEQLSLLDPTSGIVPTTYINASQPTVKSLSGILLKKKRAEANLTQGQAAIQLGVARTLVSQVESGKRNASSKFTIQIEQWIPTKL